MRRYFTGESFGTWSLDGREFPAAKGDVLYVEPRVYHGVTNTGDKPLTFLVVRYNAANPALVMAPRWTLWATTESNRSGRGGSRRYGISIRLRSSPM
jgi:oxalate decarboxylase/phosphoglucose isomerase-like protein (cupin superfamily)